MINFDENMLEKKAENEDIGHQYLDNSEIEDQVQQISNLSLEEISESEYSEEFYKKKTLEKRRETTRQKHKELFKQMYVMTAGRNLYDETEKTEYMEKFYYNQFFLTELLNALYSLITILLSMMHYEMTYQKWDNQSLIHKYSTLLYFNSVFSILLWINIFYYHMIYVKFRKFKGYYLENDTLLSTGRWKKIALELILVIIHPNIFCDGYMFYNNFNVYNAGFNRTYNSVFGIIIFGRFFYILRFSLYIFDDYMNTETNKICKSFFFQANYFYSMKVLFKNRPAIFTLLGAIAVSFSTAYAVRMYERELVNYSGKDYENITNTWWLIWITMLTVGYGDISAKSSEGRVFSLVACILGICLTSLVLITVFEYLKFTPIERTAYNILKKVDENKYTHYLARQLIKKFGKFSLKQMKEKSNKSKYHNKERFNSDIKDICDEFNNLENARLYEINTMPLNPYTNSLSVITREFKQLREKQSSAQKEIKYIKNILNNLINK